MTTVIVSLRRKFSEVEFLTTRRGAAQIYLHQTVGQRSQLSHQRKLLLSEIYELTRDISLNSRLKLSVPTKVNI